MGNSNYSYNSRSETENYNGKLENGKKHGKGTLKTNIGVYVGDFSNDMMHGKGQYTFFNGDVYEGEVKQNVIHGKGKCIYQNGNVYEGEWKYGQQHGIGKMIYIQTGDVYDGEWQRHKKHGYGSYLFKLSGSRYEGEYRNGLRNGKGRVYYANHKIMEAKFINGKIQFIYNIYHLLHNGKSRSHGVIPSSFEANQGQFEGKEMELLQQSLDSFDEHNLCSICLSKIKSKCSNQNTALACGHTFHTCCIDIWLEKSSICPLCRTSLPVKLPAGKKKKRFQSFQQQVYNSEYHANNINLRSSSQDLTFEEQ